MRMEESLPHHHQDQEVSIVFRGDIVKDDFGFYAVFTEQGSSAFQMTVATIIIQITRARQSAKDIVPIFKRCSARHRQTFFDSRNVYVFDIGSICIQRKELF